MRPAFMIIGAQKAGTTSLFEYIRHHPQIHMPAQKEIGFFSSDYCYARGWEWYESVALRAPTPGMVCGEASVGYMSGTSDRRWPGQPVELDPPSGEDQPAEDIIPQRIRQHAPDVKLICVLRDPIIRALSHYRMMVLAGTEQRTFEQAIEAALTPSALHHARTTIDGSNGYVARGEYHRILAGFTRAFAREQMLVLFNRDLARDPVGAVARVFDFIGVDPQFKAENLHVRYRQAAVDKRLPGLDLYAWQARASQANIPRALWRALPPSARARADLAYQRASFVIDVWNARRGAFSDGIAAHVHDALSAHFRPDGEALEAALGLEVPWLVRWSQMAELRAGASGRALTG